MTGLTCRGMKKHFDDFLDGDLPPRQRALVEEHLQRCASCRERVELWNDFTSAVRNVSLDPLPRLVERRIAIGAVAHRLPEKERPARIKRRAVTVGVAVAACALLVIFGHSSINSSPKLPSTPSVSSAARVRGDVSLGDSQKEKEVYHPITTLDDGRRVVSVAPGTNLWLEQGTEIRVDRIETKVAQFHITKGRVVAEVNAPVSGYRFIVTTPSSRVAVKGTIFAVEVHPSGTEIVRVIRGSVAVRSSTSEDEPPTKERTVVAGQELRYRGRVYGKSNLASASDMERDLVLIQPPTSNGAIGSLEDIIARTVTAARELQGKERSSADRETGGDHTARKMSLASSTHVADKPETDDESMLDRYLTAAENFLDTERDETPSSDQNDASEETTSQQGKGGDERLSYLMSRALDQRKSGLYPAAAETYQQIVREFPERAVARNALVSLGQLELEELAQPKLAAQRFSQYLAFTSKGPLAEEARLGQVRAYARMGLVSYLETAATYYLETHPHGYASAEVLWQRAKARKALGNCVGAKEDIDTLLQWWPTSKEARLAKKENLSCD